MSEWMDRLVHQMAEEDPRKRGVITGFKETLKFQTNTMNRLWFSGAKADEKPAWVETGLYDTR